MKIGVSPWMLEHFPHFLPVCEDPEDVYDMTLCHVSERDAAWLNRRYRRLRPVFLGDVESAEKMLVLLRHDLKTLKKQKRLIK